MHWRYFGCLIGFIWCFGCKPSVIVPEVYKPTSDHDAYRHGLVQAGLGNSILAKRWLAKADSCLSAPTYIRLPHKERFFIDELMPQAYSYRLKTRRGQKIMASVVADSISPTQGIFMDVFQVTLDTLNPFQHVASADSSKVLGFEPQEDGEYILRLQPELLKRGRFTLAIKEVPVFAFPVSGRTEINILSVFGDERDAGRRIHEGNDIFAARHAPIIAVTAGVVSFAGERGLGGKQV